jgi:hypothetical protein
MRTSTARFGAGFATRLAAAEPGAWFGPVPSSYGLHLVWIRERSPAVTPSLDAVRGASSTGGCASVASCGARDRIAALRAR